MMDSKEKVALVTGGARRVGRAICLALHKEGYRIVIHCNLSTAEAEELKKQMNGARKNTAAIVQGDLSKDVAETAKKIVEEAASKWRKLDLVVNNASNFVASTLYDVTSENWDLSMNVNVKAPVFIMQAAAPFLKEQKGSIVNISDLLGMNPVKSHFSHGISKASLIHATTSAAATMGPEVRVNAIAPGYILWPEVDLDKFKEEAKQEWLRNTPLKRIGCPEDVAQAIIFLASPSANYITGEVLKIDGGRDLHF